MKCRQTHTPWCAGWGVFKGDRPKYTPCSSCPSSTCGITQESAIIDSATQSSSPKVSLLKTDIPSTCPRRPVHLAPDAEPMSGCSHPPSPARTVTVPNGGAQILVSLTALTQANATKHFTRVDALCDHGPIGQTNQHPASVNSCMLTSYSLTQMPGIRCFKDNGSPQVGLESFG